MVDAHPLLARLLDEAMPFNEFASSRPQPASSSSAKPDAPSPTNHSAADIEVGVAAVRYLLDNEKLSVGGYTEWMRLQVAFKNSYGDDGFAPWLAFSEEADGFESEEACRKQWDGHKPRVDGTQLTIATYIAAAKEAGWTSPRRSQKKASGDGGPSKNEDHAAYTVGLVDEAGDELWLDLEGKPHATYGAAGPDDIIVRRHLPVLGAAYREVLKDRFFDAAGGLKTLKSDAADAAAAILAARAKRSGKRFDARLRVGELENRIYVDLGGDDGSAVEVSAEGWRIVDDPPVRFVRGSRGALPSPQHGGSLSDFERHFNLSPEDLLRFIGFMVGAFNVGASYAILMTDGAHGTGKSMLNDKGLALTDPPRQAKSARMSFASKEEDLHVGALNAHVLSFDNISHFGPDAADMLCRIATGGASGRRELYTNDQFSQFTIIRPVMITCIGLPSNRPDLLDRSIAIVAQPLPTRRTERSVMLEFEKDRPKLLGFLFECVAMALKNRDAVEKAVEDGEVELPRMADFAAFVEGAADVLGLPRGGFSALLREGQNDVQIEAVTGSPVGAALVQYFSRSNSVPLNASANDILRTLRGDDPHHRRWPAPNGFGAVLKRITPGLKLLGIGWSETAARGHDNVKKYQLWATADFKPAAFVSGYISHDPGNDGDGHF